MNTPQRLLCTFTIFSTLLSTACSAQTTSSAVSFKKHVISDVFTSEGVATGDVNNDGLNDILAGPFWYEAPGWKQHRIHADTANPVPGYSTSFLNYSMDVNSDGWLDMIRFDQPGAFCDWYENPKGVNKPWARHIILATAGNETPLLVDVDGDGRPDLICNDTEKKQMLWLKAPSAKADTNWQRIVISNDSTLATHRYTHGLGWGDVNQDGKNDVIIKDGWWQSPGDVMQSPWVFHPADFGEECSNMFVLDVDEDGDMDIISSSAHNYGIWWHEQQKNGNAASWVTHEISKAFSQTHAMIMQDMNGDGHPDLVTGKRYFAHNGNDPGEYEPAVIYWFEFKPGKTPQWIPHEVDNNSGIGNRFVVTDLNKDGLPDIVTSNKKGTYYFEGQK
ncbi:FG-GAP repeat domain-containing protein [Foetidibacter luteolus]|uniref:FG-GAP repeat domain-containing protein n=1 Tax=Foetidibacter luteolus TaxID=2608880 RepID=UPI00129B856A|nr:VCBS repeat-containing protein [Foetidibacter luteolus]